MGDCGKGCLGGPGGVAGCDMNDPFGRGWSVGQDCVQHRFELGRPHIVAGSLLGCSLLQDHLVTGANPTKLMVLVRARACAPTRVLGLAAATTRFSRAVSTGARRFLEPPGIWRLISRFRPLAHCPGICTKYATAPGRCALGAVCTLPMIQHYQPIRRGHRVLSPEPNSGQRKQCGQED